MLNAPTTPFILARRRNSRSTVIGKDKVIFRVVMFLLNTLFIFNHFTTPYTNLRRKSYIKYNHTNSYDPNWNPYPIKRLDACFYGVLIWVRIKEEKEKCRKKDFYR